MPDQPSTERFKTDASQISGVPGRNVHVQSGFKPARLIGFLAALVFSLVCVRWLMLPKARETPTVTPTPQIEVPAPAGDPNAALPLATQSQPSIASVEEMLKPWASKDFVYRNRISGEDVPAVLVHLSSSSASSPKSYWAFSLNAPFGNCRLEYVTDLGKLKTDYGFSAAKHPMVGNPCSRTVYDPLKMMNIPGSVWVRGAIVQGSDVRPPLGIEVEIHDRQILAVRME
jgi:tetrahydromethanopterin S-methyltransferase subunit F